MFLFGIVGLGVKQWRNTLWGVGFFGVLFVMLQILGGVNPSP
jgi:type IV secretory pathway TrbD component